MKKLLVLLLSLFFLSSPSVFADGISDFQIEGISIGDSLLDYMTEDEILEEIERNKNDYSYLKEPNKYAEVYLWKDLTTYDSISIFIENKSANQYVTNKNEEFTIVTLRGMISYNEDYESCIQKRDEISEVLSGMFVNLEMKKQSKSHEADPSGNSKMEGFTLFFPSGDSIQTYCNDWEETFRIKHNLSEGLSVIIYSEEVLDWILTI